MLQISILVNIKVVKYCTCTKFYYLFYFTIFTDPEDTLNLNCTKYYEIGINL